MTSPESFTLRYYPDPVLRVRATAVGEITPEVRDRLREMFRIMYENAGIGLALR